MKVQIRFSGEAPDLKFVEVENAETGESISLGAWSADGPDALLVFETDKTAAWAERACQTLKDWIVARSEREAFIPYIGQIPPDHFLVDARKLNEQFDHLVLDYLKFNNQSA